MRYLNMVDVKMFEREEWKRRREWMNFLRIFNKNGKAWMQKWDNEGNIEIFVNTVKVWKFEYLEVNKIPKLKYWRVMEGAKSNWQKLEHVHFSLLYSMLQLTYGMECTFYSSTFFFFFKFFQNHLWECHKWIDRLSFYFENWIDQLCVWKTLKRKGK